MPEERIYLIKEVKIEYAGKIVTVESLVHENGLKRVFEQSNLPEGFVDLVGKNCEVSFDDFRFRGRFSREATPLGIFYNIHFQANESERRRIAAEIRASGVPAPWRRRFARLSTGTKDGDLPVPFLAVGKGLKLEGIFFNVLNFTLGGLLLECPPDNAFAPKLNQEIQFDLITNTGDKIENIKAVVMHVTEDISPDETQPNTTFGIRIMPMNMINEVKYNGLIRDFLVGYKRKMKMR